MSYSFEWGDYYQENTTILDDGIPYVVDPLTVSCEIKQLDPTVSLILCVLLIGIFLLAIPGNVLVGWVIITSRQSLTPSDVYLFHLTIADGLMALTFPFFATARVKGWIFGDFLCKLLNLIIEANFYTSIIFLACISVDRYMVIVRASESLRSRQKVCSRILCAAVWAFGWALALPALFNDATEMSGRMTCIEVYDIGRPSIWRLVTRLLLHIFGFLLPLGIMVTCYTITIARLLHTRGFQKHRAMRVIITVVIAFLLCWTPYHITMMVDTAIRANVIVYDCTMRRSVKTALEVTNSLALFHSCINPVLYAFVGVKFRRNMMLSFRRTVRRERASLPKYSRSTSQTSDFTGAVL